MKINKNKWQKIETAPLDGTRIRVTLIGIEWVAWWDKDKEAFCYAHGYYIDMPTHWQRCEPILDMENN